tara:strand:- start:126 stop:323 length:198 start_codon:yes stop_codon:yes gene_type:complete
MNVLQNVMQIIDSISDKIPENVYLSLCNELKKLYAFIPDQPFLEQIVPPTYHHHHLRMDIGFDRK